MASTFKPGEAADLLNNWTHERQILDLMGGQKSNIFHELISSYQVLAAITVVCGITMAVCMVVLHFPGLQIWVALDTVIASNIALLQLIPARLW